MYDDGQGQPQNMNGMLLASQIKRQNDYNMLVVRLDTQDLLNQIKEFLTGKQSQVIQDPESGMITESLTQVGERKANDLGIQTIYNRVQTIINPSTVQGNFAADKSGYSEQYESFIIRFNISILDEIMDNMYSWDIKEENIGGIVDFITFLVDAFLTRLINNEERRSYGESLRTVEQTTNTQGSGFRLPIFGGRKQ